jgi:hypothetical protein
MFLKAFTKRIFPDGNRVDQNPARKFVPVARMMGTIVGEVVNLKRFRKRAARDQSAKQADANRARFGRTKSERALDQQRASRANDMLEQHRIDGEDAP